MKQMLFEGCKVWHKTYGIGTIARVERNSKDIEAIPKSGLRHKNSLNVGVIFDDGGPQGWAEDGSNDILELKRLDEMRRAA